MNTYPNGRGFGFAPNIVAFHAHAGNTPLQWATFSLVLLIALTLGALVIARFARGGHRGSGYGPPRMKMHGPGRPDPLEILRMRFASGQITRDELLQGTADLTGAAPPPQPQG
jgi:hypothetical protein